MRVNAVPTATVLFRDGHTETTTSVILRNHELAYVVTNSGCYMASPDFDSHYIFKYHPEYTLAQISMTGHIEYDLSECWQADPSVKEIKILLEPVRSVDIGVNEYYD